ncbi:MAG: hypothetical protein KIH62_000135 [Candidatus Kerfeldbacteria bacterium]|nr:hypothetical protein [Candidatus Kerfeldbacteria bacterium]
MGTEIFPLLLVLARVLIFVILGIVILVSALSGYQMMHEKDHAKREELKKYILNALIALTIVVIVYVVLVGIGPAFNIIFNQSA